MQLLSYVRIVDIRNFDFFLFEINECRQLSFRNSLQISNISIILPACLGVWINFSLFNLILSKYIIMNSCGKMAIKYKC